MERVLARAMRAARKERGEGKLSDRNARVLASFQAHQLSQKPFRPLQEKGSAKSYYYVWKQLLCFATRVHYGTLKDPRDRPLASLSER